MNFSRVSQLIFFAYFLNLASTKISDGFDVKVVTKHQLDSFNFLLYTFLLVLSILTVLVFKCHRFRFIHETGLIIIYGFVVGALIRYTGKKSESSPHVVDVTLNESKVPEVLHIQLANASGNSTTLHKYSFHSSFNSSDLSNLQLRDKMTFDPEVFFNVILPPIIFNAGYHMKRRHFFQNIGSILTFALVGTTISALTTAGLMYGLCNMVSSKNLHLFSDCFFFGAIISATDPVTILAIFNDLNVDVDMYALVFGESILNDAVAIVLATSINNYQSHLAGFDGLAILKSFGFFLQVFLGSLILGTVMGYATSLITKFTQLRTYPTLETCILIFMSYAAFFSAESLKLSGIVSVLFCGICQAHYTFNNLSSDSQRNSRELFHLISFLMETFVFLYIGVSTFTLRQHQWDILLIFFAIISVLVARASNIYPLSFLLNLGRSHKITPNMQHVMMFSGLRGAMAFALALRDTSSIGRQTILSITLIIVVSTVLLLGGLTTQVLHWFKIRVGVQEVEYSVDLAKEPLNDDVPIDPSVAQKSKFALLWSNLDKRFFKPLLTHSRPSLTETVPRGCGLFARLFTSSQQLNQTGRANAITPPATFSFSAPHQQLLPPNDPKVKSIDSGTPLMSEQQDTTAKALNTTSCSDADNCDDQELLILSDENNDI